MLIRPDRSLLAFVLGTVLLAVAAQGGATSVVSLLIAIVVALVLSRHVLTRGAMWNERVRLSMDDRGVTLVRSNGQRQQAAWRFFERASLQRRRALDDLSETSVWRLTLVNAFKPSIGSFLHATGAERTVFCFPLTIDFKADASDADRIGAMTAANIELAQAKPSNSPHRPVTVDLTRLFSVHACVKCDYPLRGLSASHRCPECGWKFDGSMFELNGQTFDQALTAWVGLGVVAIVGAGLALMTVGVPFALAMSMAIVASVMVRAWWTATPLSRVWRKRVLVSDAGLHIWFRGEQVAHYPWSAVGEARMVLTDAGRTRIAFWDHPKLSIRFSQALETWRAWPPGSPVVDVLVNEPRHAAELLYAEMQHRLQKRCRMA